MKKSILFLWLTLFVALLHASENSPTAADFSWMTTSGDKIKLSDFKGKVVILDFWASWCKPCQAELPFLVELFDNYKNQELMIVTVNLDEYEADKKKFLAKLNVKVPFPIISDKDGKLPSLYQVEGMPTTLFIDKKGAIRYRHTGFKKSHRKKYEEELQTLLQEK